MKTPKFYVKRGYFGDKGLKQIGFLRWLWMRIDYVTVVKWVENKTKGDRQ